MTIRATANKASCFDISVRSANWQAGVSGWELTPDGSLRIYGQPIRRCRSA